MAKNPSTVITSVSQRVSATVNEGLIKLIEKLVMVQDKMHKNDPAKALQKQRYIMGCKETMENIDKVVCIIMATNVNSIRANELIKKLLACASENDIPVINGPTHLKIGYLCHKKGPVECFAIVNHKGAQEQFNSVMELIPKTKQQYDKLVASRCHNNTDEDEDDDMLDDDNDGLESIDIEQSLSDLLGDTEHDEPTDDKQEPAADAENQAAKNEKPTPTKINSIASSIQELAAITNKKLTEENKKLTADKRILQREKTELIAEKEKLVAQNRRLIFEGQELAAKNKKILEQNNELLSEHRRLLITNKKLQPHTEMEADEEQEP